MIACLTIAVQTPAIYASNRQQAAAVKEAEADFRIGTSLRVRLAEIIIPPAIDAAVRFQAAGMPLSGAGLGERTGLVLGLTEIVGSPAVDIAIDPDGADGRAHADIGIGAILIIGIAGPAIDAACRFQRAGTAEDAGLADGRLG